MFQSWRWLLMSLFFTNATFVSFQHVKASFRNFFCYMFVIFCYISSGQTLSFGWSWCSWCLRWWRLWRSRHKMEEREFTVFIYRQEKILIIITAHWEMDRRVLVLFCLLAAVRSVGKNLLQFQTALDYICFFRNILVLWS